MTTEEMATLVETKNVRGRLVGLLIKEFPKEVRNVEDWAQRALVRAFKNADKFYDEDGLIGYTREVAIGLALNDRTTDKERRKLLRGVAKTAAKTYDPYKQLDYKIDLERGIQAVVGHPTLRKAMWHIHYEKWTWEETLESMPSDKSTNTWHMALIRANKDLKAEMRRKGYRRG